MAVGQEGALHAGVDFAGELVGGAANGGIAGLVGKHGEQRAGRCQALHAAQCGHLVGRAADGSQRARLHHVQIHVPCIVGCGQTQDRADRHVAG